MTDFMIRPSVNGIQGRRSNIGGAAPNHIDPVGIIDEGIAVLLVVGVDQVIAVNLEFVDGVLMVPIQ